MPTFRNIIFGVRWSWAQIFLILINSIIHWASDYLKETYFFSDRMKRLSWITFLSGGACVLVEGVWSTMIFTEKPLCKNCIIVISLQNYILENYILSIKVLFYKLEKKFLSPLSSLFLSSHRREWVKHLIRLEGENRHVLLSAFCILSLGVACLQDTCV